MSKIEAESDVMRRAATALRSGIRIDDTDRTILMLLAENARLSYSELARRVHLSPPALIERVRKLERAGVIRGYYADIDPRKLGHEIEVFVHLSCTRSA